MALSQTQKYLNLAFSLLLSNKSGTDEHYSLPDSFRKFENLKVEAYEANMTHVPAGNSLTIGEATSQDMVFLIIGTHPFRISLINNVTMGNSLNTSFFLWGRDRAGDANATGPNLLYLENTLASPTFETVTGSNTAAMDVLVLQIKLEA